MIKPILDSNFMPASIFNKDFLMKADEKFSIAVERENRLIYRYDTLIIKDDLKTSCFYIERLIKSIMWSIGGFKITVGGNEFVGKYIADCYKKGGIREFDVNFMSRVYEKPFEVILTSIDNMPTPKDNSVSIGRHLNGSRIGFYAGGSDMKVSVGNSMVS